MHIVVFSMMYAPDDFKINDIVLELIRHHAEFRLQHV